MSDPDNFLARWSRRKQKVAEAERDAGNDAQGAPDDQLSASDPEQAAPGPAQPDAVRGAEVVSARAAGPAFDLASLPAIESITAETDIRGFLAPGVPVDLARAALRRAWQSDPGIWNFIERADYDWDFNAADSVPGFGPLDMTPDLRRAVARIMGDVLPEDSPAAPAEVRAPQPPDPVAQIQAEPAPIKDDRGPRPVDLPTRTVESQFSDRPPRSRSDHIALQQVAESKENLQAPAKRSHGRALPK